MLSATVFLNSINNIFSKYFLTASTDRLAQWLMTSPFPGQSNLTQCRQRVATAANRDLSLELRCPGA